MKPQSVSASAASDKVGIDTVRLPKYVRVDPDSDSESKDEIKVMDKDDLVPCHDVPVETGCVLGANNGMLKLPKGLKNTWSSSNKIYTVRCYSPTVVVNASASATFTDKISFSPIAQTDFLAYASVFGLYRVKKMVFEIYPKAGESASVADNVRQLIIGSDPSTWITGTPTSTGVNRLPGSKLLVPFNVSAAHPIRINMSGVRTAVPLAAPTPDGFIFSTVAWGGQCVIFGQTQATGSYFVYLYRVMWEIDFKARAGP